MSFISAGQLREGLSYLHRNFLFIRTIDGLDGETVLWHDQTGPGRCSRKVFARQCISLAPEDDRGMEEIKSELIRTQERDKNTTMLEYKFRQICSEAVREKTTYVSITDPRLLGSTYEEVMRNLLVLEESRLYLRING